MPPSNPWPIRRCASGVSVKHSNPGTSQKTSSSRSYPRFWTFGIGKSVKWAYSPKSPPRNPWFHHSSVAMVIRFHMSTLSRLPCLICLCTARISTSTSPNLLGQGHALLPWPFSSSDKRPNGLSTGVFQLFRIIRFLPTWPKRNVKVLDSSSSCRSSLSTQIQQEEVSFVSARIEHKARTDKAHWHLEIDQEKRRIVMQLATIPIRSYLLNRWDLAMVEVA